MTWRELVAVDRRANAPASFRSPHEEDRMKNHVKKNIEIVPANFTSVTPWIVSSSTSKMIDFLTAAFEAEEIPHSRIKNKEGVIINAVVKIGTAMVMLFDSREGWSP
ncbi:MAG: hypothetical protein ABSG12_10520, partial [Steroidobacteraceae bacterium]